MSYRVNNRPSANAARARNPATIAWRCPKLTRIALFRSPEPLGRYDDASCPRCGAPVSGYVRLALHRPGHPTVYCVCARHEAAK